MCILVAKNVYPYTFYIHFLCYYWQVVTPSFINFAIHLKGIHFVSNIEFICPKKYKGLYTCYHYRIL